MTTTEIVLLVIISFILYAGVFIFIYYVNRNRRLQKTQNETTIEVKKEEQTVQNVPPPNNQTLTTQFLGEGTYRVGFRLGRGMNAVTYRVENTKQPGNPLVAKVLLTPEEEPRITSDSFSRHMIRFNREVDHLSILQGNPYIVPLHSSHLSSLPPFFLMRLCEGSLKDEIQRRLPDMQLILDVLGDVCRGLLYIHDNGIIHRDLKPANILKYKGHWVLADFGMSLLGDKGSVITVAESLPGTIPYTAPEVMYFEVVKKTADFFSLGITLKEMLTGTNVCEGPTSSLLQTRVSQMIKREVRLFDNLITKMTSLKPEDRPQTLEEIIQELYQIFTKINQIRSRRKNKSDVTLLKRLQNFNLIIVKSSSNKMSLNND